MERKFLEGLGLEKDTIDSIMAENGKDINNAKEIRTEAFENLTAEKNNALSQLEDVRKELEEISSKAEGSEEAQAQITALQQQLEDKQKEYEETIKNKDFDNLLTQSLMKSGVKNDKAARALLPIDTLKESKNQENDITEAINSIKESDGYLFGDDTGTPPLKVDTGGNHDKKTETDPIEDILRQGL